MTFDDWFEREWQGLHDAGVAQRDLQSVLEYAEQLYDSLAPGERQEADRILSTWLQTGDEARRFDAEWLIEKFCIRSAIPSLRQLAQSLAVSPEPGGVYELEKVARILQRLLRA